MQLEAFYTNEKLGGLARMFPLYAKLLWSLLLSPPRRLCFCPFLFVCLSVCLSVRHKDNSKNYGWIFLKFWGYVGHGISYRWFNFGLDPAGILDSGSLWNFHYNCVKGDIREPLAKRRWWRHLANSFALAEIHALSECFLLLVMMTMVICLFLVCCCYCLAVKCSTALCCALAYLRPSRELLEYYRKKIAEFDDEHESMLQRLDQYRMTYEEQVSTSIAY